MYEKNVELGMAWLDGKLPEWINIVDLPSLEMGSIDLCPLGQLRDKVKFLNTDCVFIKACGILKDECGGSLVTHGFDLDKWEHEDMVALTDTWKNAILKKRGKAPMIRMILDAQYEGGPTEQELQTLFAKIREALKESPVIVTELIKGVGTIQVTKF